MTYPTDLPDGHSSQGHLTILIDGQNRCPACAACAAEPDENPILHPALAVADGELRATPSRLEFTPRWRDLMGLPGPDFYVCDHCTLAPREHINDRFCPEWRLRQLDGDR